MDKKQKIKIIKVVLSLLELVIILIKELGG